MTTKKPKEEVVQEVEELTEEQELMKVMEETFEVDPEPEEKPKEEPAEDEETPLNDDEPPAEEEPAEPEEPADLLEKYAAPAEPEPEKVKLQEFEAYLNQEHASIQEANKKIADLNTLKDDKGVGILEMTDEQFGEYLQALQDTGKMELSAKAQYNRNKAIDLYSEYTERVQKYQSDYSNYNDYKESIEDAPKWTQAGDEFEASYPGFKDAFGAKVRDFLEPLLDKKSQSFNKDLYQLTRTDEGKKRAVVQALQQLRLLEDVKALADGSGPQPKTEKKPSAPDVTAQRKKVQVNSPERDSTATKAQKVASMSQKEFNKLSDEEIGEAMFASLQPVSD